MSVQSSKEKLDQLFSEFMNLKKQAEDELKQLEEKKKTYQLEIQKMEELKVKWSDNITINVGGEKFTVSKSTLIKYENSMLSAMFSGRHAITKDEKGRPFIDRDKDLFQYVLSFLRAGEEWEPPEGSVLLNRLKKEFDYFGLKFLEKAFKGSTLLTDQQKEKLHEWCSSRYNWKLIFKASIHGFRASEFHNHCNHKGPTLSVISSNHGNIFGGYTSVSWVSSGGYQSDPNAWVFSLTHGMKFSIKGGNNAIYDNSSYGPTFGGGHDFQLCDNCNSINSSYSNFGHTYNTPPNQDVQSYLAGSYNFTVTDYEVYSYQ